LNNPKRLLRINLTDFSTFPAESEFAADLIRTGRADSSPSEIG